jgi:hypothetical protein
MKCKTRKLIFIAAFAILISLLFTCKPFASGDFEQFGDDEITYTDVVYSRDGKSLTVYLDGTTVPVTKRQSRALNLRLAQLGHDYFEVAFMYNNGGQYAIARAAWETGHAAGVTGVYRTAGGIDYSSTGEPGSGSGAAIIFVGKKSDKTLLAVGRLKFIGTADVAVDPKIYSTTKSVTFEVVPLETKIDFVANINTSFWTAAKELSPNATWDNTHVTSLLVARTPTPAFAFPFDGGGYKNTNAIYTIRAGGGGITGYLPGIRIAENIGSYPFNNVYKTKPQYPKGDGEHDDSTVGIGLEVATNITLINNRTAGLRFEPAIEFTFSTLQADDGKINAFYFEIPVVPLNTGGNPGKWYIRPGYDSYLKDLDNGAGGTGGAVLFGVGDLGYMDPQLRVTKDPFKLNYNDHYNWIFDPDQMVVYLVSGALRIKKIELNELTYFVGFSQEANQCLAVNEIIPGVTDLTDIAPRTGGGPRRNAFDAYDGGTNMLIITIRYYDGSTYFYGQFVIYRSEGLSISGSDDVAPGNRVVIHGPLDMTYFYNRMNDSRDTGGVFIIISYFSFDIHEIHLNASNFTFIILAGAPDLVFGRDIVGAIPGNIAPGGFHHYSGSTGNTYFLGVWPFNEPVSVDGMAITTYPFTINAMGSYVNVNAGKTAATAPTFTGGYIGMQAPFTNPTVHLGGGVKVLNTNSNLVGSR